MFAEDEQVMDLRKIAINELINFLLSNRPDFRQRRRRRISSILIQAIRARLRAVTFELAAEHFAVARPAVKRVARRVDADECVTGLDPIQKSLLARNRQIAQRARENNTVIIFQIVRRKFFAAQFLTFHSTWLPHRRTFFLFRRRIGF